MMLLLQKHNRIPVTEVIAVKGKYWRVSARPKVVGQVFVGNFVGHDSPSTVFPHISTTTTTPPPRTPHTNNTRKKSLYQFSYEACDVSHQCMWFLGSEVKRRDWVLLTRSRPLLLLDPIPSFAREGNHNAI